LRVGRITARIGLGRGIGLRNNRLVSLMKYCIVLRSKFTGEEVHLGSSYESAEKAKIYVESAVCSRCNYIDVRAINDSYRYGGKHLGFASSLEE